MVNLINFFFNRTKQTAMVSMDQWFISTYIQPVKYATMIKIGTNLAAENLVHQCIHILGVECMFQRCHFIDTTAESPHIRLKYHASDSHVLVIIIYLCKM